MNYKALIMFVVIAYAGYYVGGIAVDYLAPMLPSIFTGLIGDVLRFSIPTAVVFWGWLKFGKSG